VKNKKLFAILTLVCFMFTLMPVAAFADGEYIAVLEDGEYVDKVTVQASVSTNVAAVVTGSAAQFYFWAEDADEEVVALGSGAGDNEFAFDEVGTYYVYAVESTKLAGDGVKAVFDSATATKATIINTVKDRYEDLIVDEYLTVKVKKADVTYSFAPVADVNIAADNGWSADGTVTVKLLKNGSTPVKGEAIKFSTNSGYVKVELVDAVTDRSGEQEIKITATKAGNYKVYAAYEDADKLEIVVNVGEAGVAYVETVAAPKTPVALGDTLASYTGIAFQFKDVNGTILDTIKNDTSNTSAFVYANDTSDAIKVQVVEAPADSDLLGEEVGLRYDGVTNNAWTLMGGSFDEEGTYTFKVVLENGKSATASVNVKEFDEPTSMMLLFNQDTVGLDGAATVKAVTLLDKNYTSRTIYASARPAGTEWLPGYTGEIEFVANGKAVETIDATTGTVYTFSANEVDAEKVVGTKISVMAIYEDLDLVATAELDVVNGADALKYVDTTADIAVNNDLEVIVVDEDGKEVDVNLTGAELKVYVLSAPANAAYDAEGIVTDELTVRFTASAAGEYKLQSVLTYDGGKYLSSVDTIVVGGTAGDFKDVVVLSMGSNNMIVNDEVVALDVAPFVEAGRTMMQYTALAAFGIDFTWDEATRSVVAEGNGVKVVMTIDSKVAVVNGEEVVMEVAPQIINGRTVIPVTYATNPFGIVATALYDANGVSDVLFTAGK